MGKVIAFDVETPNCRNHRICSIGVTIIEDSNITWSRNYYVNPECSFDDRNIQIHGIRPADVTDAPTFPHVWEEIAPLFRNNMVIAHNAKFDLCVLKKTLSAYGLIERPLVYLCTMKMAQAMLQNLPDAKLSTLCRYFGIELKHHDSGSDSLACAEIYCRLIECGAVDEEYIQSYSLEHNAPPIPPSSSKHMADNTRGLITLRGILSGITCDDLLVPSEVEFLRNWLDENRDLKGNYPYDRVYTAIETALSDGRLDNEELEYMLALFKQVFDPLNDCSCDCDKLSIEGKTYCLSGEFDYGCGNRSAVDALLMERGGIPHKSVTKKTDFLIVGGQGSAAWSAGNYGNKVKRALELQEKGCPIRIIREHDII